MRKTVMFNDALMLDVRNTRYGSQFGVAFTHRVSDEEWETIEHVNVVVPPDCVPEGGLRKGWYADFVGIETLEFEPPSDWSHKVMVSRIKQTSPNDPSRFAL
jgi:hypothetical protein